MGVCWGGMAMLNHFYGVPKHMLPEKAFGCYRHCAVEPVSPFLQGFSDSFVVPVSRWTEVRGEEVMLHPELRVLIFSDEVGPCLIDDPDHRALYMFNHLEYDSTTLKEEYDRDLAGSGPVALPVNYFPDDDPGRLPENRWRSHGQLLYRNWINEIYQTTPYEIDGDRGRRPPSRLRERGPPPDARIRETARLLRRPRPGSTLATPVPASHLLVLDRGGSGCSKRWECGERWSGLPDPDRDGSSTRASPARRSPPG